MIDVRRGLLAGVSLLLAGAVTSGCYTEVGDLAAESPDSGVTAEQSALTDLGEAESNSFQMAMDRRAKYLSTLNNVLKKSSDTQKSIIQNIR